MSDAVFAPESQRVPRFDREAVRDEIRTMNTDALRAALVSGLRLSVEHLLRTVLIYQELQDRGEKVEGVPAGLLAILGRIARGDLLAEVVVCFAGAPTVMARIGKMPIEEQQAVIGDENRVKDLLRPRPRRAMRNGTLHSEKTGSALADCKESDLSSLLRAAEKATARDLADTIVLVVEQHPDPAAVWAAVDTLRRRTSSRTG